MLWAPGKEAPRSGRLHGGGEAQDGALMGGWEFSGRTIKELPASLSSGCPGGWVALSPGPTPHLHLGSSSLAECMNCTRLSDMSERLITLEAKVRQTGEPGPGELAVGRMHQAPAECGWGTPASGSPAGLSSLVPGVGRYQGPGSCGWPSVGWATSWGGGREWKGQEI